MNIDLEKLFKSYDFGYNLDLILAENWNYSNNHHYRHIYLEDNSKSISTPISATFNIFLHEDGSIREVVVDML